MKSRRNLLIGAACVLAVTAALVFEPATSTSLTSAPAASSAKPSKPKSAAATAATIAPATGAAGSAGEHSVDSSGEPSRMTAAAGRDLFARKSWKVAPPPASPPKPVAPPFPYVFSGSMRDAGDAGAVILFIKAGNRNFIVRKGETVDTAYRLDDITEKEAVFTYIPLQQQQRLTIGNTN